MTAVFSVRVSAVSISHAADAVFFRVGGILFSVRFFSLHQGQTRSRAYRIVRDRGAFSARAMGICPVSGRRRKLQGDLRRDGDGADFPGVDVHRVGDNPVRRGADRVGATRRHPSDARPSRRIFCIRRRCTSWCAWRIARTAAATISRRGRSARTLVPKRRLSLSSRGSNRAASWLKPTRARRANQGLYLARRPGRSSWRTRSVRRLDRRQRRRSARRPRAGEDARCAAAAQDHDPRRHPLAGSEGGRSATASIEHKANRDGGFQASNVEDMEKIEPRSSFINLNGVRPHTLDWGGDGDPIVILHATGFFGRIYRPFAERCARSGIFTARSARPRRQSAARDRYTTGCDDERPRRIHRRDGLVGCARVRPFLGRDGDRLARVRTARSDRARGAGRADGVRVAGSRRNSDGAIRSSSGRSNAAACSTASRRCTRISRTSRRTTPGARKFCATIASSARVRRDGKRELKCAPEVEAKFYETSRDFDGLGRILRCAAPMLVMFGARGDSLGASLSGKVAAAAQEWPRDRCGGRGAFPPDGKAGLRRRAGGRVPASLSNSQSGRTE